MVQNAAKKPDHRDRSAEQGQSNIPYREAFVALIGRVAELGAFDEAHRAAREIPDVLTVEKALTRIARHLPEPKLETVFKAKGSERWPQTALAVFIPRMRETFLPELYRMLTTAEIDDHRARANAQNRLFERLVYNGSHEAVMAALPYVENTDEAAQILALIASDLPESSLDAAINFATTVPCAEAALVRLLPQLSKYDRADEALTRIRGLSFESSRICALIDLIQLCHLDDVGAHEGFSLLREICAENDPDWASMLERLAAQLPASLLSEAISAAKKLTESLRCRVLAKLSVRLAETGNKESGRLETETIGNESWRKYSQAQIELVDPVISLSPHISQPRKVA
jgi:hypothetical protein